MNVKREGVDVYTAAPDDDGMLARFQGGLHDGFF